MDNDMDMHVHVNSNIEQESSKCGASVGFLVIPRHTLYKKLSVLAINS